MSLPLSFVRRSVFVGPAVGAALFVSSAAHAEEWRVLETSPRSCQHLSAFGDLEVICVQNNVPSAGFKSVAKTTDGGKTWSTAAAGPTGAPLAGPSFWRDPATGFLGRAAGGAPTSLVWKTANGGMSWDLKSVTPGHATILLRALHVKGAVGYAAGSKSDGGSLTAFVARTENDGESWTEVTFPGGTDHIPSNVWVLDPATAVIVTARGIWRTTNSGGEWKQVSTEFPNFGYLKFVDATHGFAGLLYKTNDAGATWTPATATLPEEKDNEDIRALDFADENNGILAHGDSTGSGSGSSAGRFWRTNNGGTSWTEEARPAAWKNAPSSVVFPSSRVAYASGSSPDSESAPSVVAAGTGVAGPSTPDGGAGPSGETPPPGNTSGGPADAGATTPAATGGDDGGCNVHRESTTRGGAVALAGLAVALLAVRRRRR